MSDPEQRVDIVPVSGKNIMSLHYYNVICIAQ